MPMAVDYDVTYGHCIPKATSKISVQKGHIQKHYKKVLMGTLKNAQVAHKKSGKRQQKQRGQTVNKIKWRTLSLTSLVT